MTGPLIHIGYHKTATTWLQRRVFNDDAGGFVRVGQKSEIDEAFVIPGPFRFDAAAARASIDRLMPADGVPVISHERLSGFDQLGGYDANVIAQRLAETYADASILIVIREQRDIMRSAYKQRIKKFGTETPDKYWRARKQRGRRWVGPSLDVYEYHDLIARYQDLFGPQRVLVLPYEQLLRDPLSFVDAIRAHAGLPPAAEVPDARENVGFPAAVVSLVRWRNKIDRALGRVPAFGPVMDQRLLARRRKTIARLQKVVPSALSKRPESRLIASVDRVAGDRFCESNRMTTKLIGVDLAEYGYMT